MVGSGIYLKLFNINNYSTFSQYTYPPLGGGYSIDILNNECVSVRNDPEVYLFNFDLLNII